MTGDVTTGATTAEAQADGSILVTTPFEFANSVKDLLSWFLTSTMKVVNLQVM